MISLNEAFKLIDEIGQPLSSYEINTLNSVGFICAEDIIATFSSPRFNNSAMDGFAVSGIKEKYIIDKIIAAGDNDKFNHEITEGCATQIMTGAKLPDNTITVIQIENVEINSFYNGSKYIKVLTEIKANQNIRRIGEDYLEGETLIKKGELISPNHIALLSSNGIRKISVYKKPSIGIITTGNEVVRDGVLKDSQIYDSNTPYLQSALSLNKIENEFIGEIKDSEDEFIRMLESHKDKDIIISSGGVSKGNFDFIPDKIKEYGGQIIFHHVKIKPGKPILFARLNDGRFFFGLAGNPVSTAVGLNLFVFRLIRKLINCKNTDTNDAIIKNDIKKKRGITHILKGIIETNKANNFVSTNLGQESFKIFDLSKTNCWVIVHEDIEEVINGTNIEYIEDCKL